MNNKSLDPEQNQKPAHKLTTEQLNIIRAREKIVVVTAAPGSGKTTLLIALAEQAAKIANFKPERPPYLFISYSRRITKEIKIKLDKLGLSGWVEVRTLHGFSLKSVANEENAAMLGFEKKPRHIDENAYKKRVRTTFQREFPEIETKTEKGKLLKLLLNGLKTNKKLTAEQHPKHAKKLNHLMQKLRANQLKTGRMTFNDYILLTKKLLKNPDALEAVCSPYQLLLVDEIQDLSHPQLDLVYKLAKTIASKPGGRAIIVGDPAQSIYTFQGAKVAGLDRLAQRLNATRYQLTRSFRLNQASVVLANCLRRDIEGPSHLKLSSNKLGQKPTLIHCTSGYEQSLEVKAIIDDLRQTHNLADKDITVLARNNINLFDLYQRLKANTNETVLLGHQDDLLKLCKSAVYLLQILDEDYDHLPEMLENFNIKKTHAQTVISPKSNKYTAFLVRKINDARKHQHFESKLGVIQDILKKYLGHRLVTTAHLNQLTAQAVTCQKTGEVIKVIENYYKSHKNGIKLQTIHSAKGLEYQAVIVIDIVDGYLPRFSGDNKVKDLAEERRIFYVGVTRHQRYLYLISSIFRVEDIKAKKVLGVKTKSRLLTPRVIKACGTRD